MPKEKEEETIPAAISQKNRPKMERAKTFIVGQNNAKNVHKTSLQSDRILPNDDLVLNQARRQKSFAGPSAKKIAQLKVSNDSVKVNLQRTASLGHLEKKEEIIRVRSLVEVDDYDGNYLRFF